MHQDYQHMGKLGRLSVPELFSVMAAPMPVC